MAAYTRLRPMPNTMNAAQLVAIYNALPPEHQQRIRNKARWEAMSIPAVMHEWPSLVPFDTPAPGATK